MELRSGRLVTLEDRPLRKKKRTTPHLQDSWGRFYVLSNPNPNLYGMIKTSQYALAETNDLSIGRSFIVVNYNTSCYQLFYRSSGHNTHYPETWFPTNGYLLSYLDGGYYDKLSNTKFSKSITQDDILHEKILSLKRPFLDSVQAINSTLLYRFGTKQFMYISSLLGGSLWEDVELVNILSQHFELPLTSSRLRYSFPTTPFEIKNIYQDVNWFAKDALSTNFCKDEYHIDSINEYVNYRNWYTHLFTIGEESRQLKAIRRFAPYEKNQCIDKPLYVSFKNEKFFLVDFLYNNLITMDCWKYDSYIHNVSSRLLRQKIMI